MSNVLHSEERERKRRGRTGIKPGMLTYTKKKKRQKIHKANSINRNDNKLYEIL